jgi:type III restriction enzyme
VIRWLRPAREQFNIYWDNGSKRYEPDFIVETADTIYMIETKAATNMSAEDVQMKKRAAEDYCKYASEFAIENNSKPWKYVLLSHDKVNRTASFDYLIHFDQF